MKKREMAPNDEPRLYFLRSKTVCRGRELKFVLNRTTDLRRPRSLEEFPAADENARAPPPMRYNPDAHRRQDEKIADLGLSLLNLRARQYQLVSPGVSSAFLTSKNFVCHANFKAKPVDDHEAPEEELFFVEVVLGGGSMEKPITDFIVQSLRFCDSLPDNVDGDDSVANVTTKCRMCETILHPKNVKLHLMPKS